MNSPPADKKPFANTHIFLTGQVYLAILITQELPITFIGLKTTHNPTVLPSPFPVFQAFYQRKVGMYCFLSSTGISKKRVINQNQEFFGRVGNRLPLCSTSLHNPFFPNFSSLAWILQTTSFLACQMESWPPVSTESSSRSSLVSISSRS